MIQRMIAVEEALSAVLARAGVLEDELVDLEECYGRVLAEDVESGVDLPPFDKSAVDGYALRSRDAAEVPVRLRVKAVLSAGEVLGGTVGEGECVKIMTGAPLPEGTDSVVMVEDTEATANASLEGRRAAGGAQTGGGEKTGDGADSSGAAKTVGGEKTVGGSDPGGGTVVVKKKAVPGGNVCLRGEDIKKGVAVLARGDMISAPEIAVLASVGRSGARVVRRPEAAVLSTGDEILEPGSVLGPGKRWNSNGPMLVALSRAAGCRAEYLGKAGDDRETLRRLFRRGFDKDLLLVSGGVSMGDYDLVPQALEEEGARVFFHKVRLKPGKPLLFAIRGKCLVFGIPGNPVSNFAVFHLFIRPAIDKLSGKRSGGPPFMKAFIERDFTTRSDRVHVVPSRFRVVDGRVSVSPFTLNGSADIVACARCNSLIVFEAGAYTAARGTEVKILPTALE
jgi:molybdopterin molybdotransferase